MTTKTKKIMPLLIISLLTLSIATLTSIQAASASNAGLIFTPNYHVDGTDPPGEESYSDSVANMIMYYFNYYGQNYNYLYNCQDSSATRSQYMSSLNYAKTTIITPYFTPRDMNGHGATLITMGYVLAITILMETFWFRDSYDITQTLT